MPVADIERAAMRSRVADADLGIAEADFAIASTGTLRRVSNANRPGSLTLLPPVSLVIVNIDHVMQNLAEVLAEMGPAGDRGESLVVHHRAEPHRGHREANRARCPRPEIVARIVMWPRDD